MAHVAAIIAVQFRVIPTEQLVESGPAGIRTRTALAGQRILSPLGGSRSADVSDVCDGDPSTATNIATNAVQNSPDLAAFAEALAALPEGDRSAVVAHIAALTRLSPAKRAAILTLTDPDDAEDKP